LTKKNRYYSPIYEDDHLLVLDKAAGVLCIPDRHDIELPSLQGILNKKYGKIYTVHRLDKQTSGVMVFAKTEDTHRKLNGLFQQHKTEKKYWVLVQSSNTPDEGVIDLPIAPHSIIKGKMKVSPKGKASFSRYKTLEKFKQHRLLEVTIETGRTHQIRVHLAESGMLLAVDELYGGGQAIKLSDFKKKYQPNKTGEEKPILQRVSLHAKELSFVHPILDKKFIWDAELPKDMAVTLKLLRKYASNTSES